MAGRPRAGTTKEAASGKRVGVLWRSRSGGRPGGDRGLAPLFDAFSSRGVEVVPVPFTEDRAGAARDELRSVDGVLVWVNPVEDGVTRRHVDALLREVAASGTWVSAHPDVIAKMGTKEVLVETRHLGWGTDTSLYRSVEELAERLPARLEEHGRLVVKQARGNGGEGVWSVELAAPSRPAGPRAPVYVREACAGDGDGERVTLEKFVRRLGPYFDWSGALVDQPYQRRLAEGMVRCYLSHDEVVGFSRQWPRGLLDDPVAPPRERAQRIMTGPDVADFRLLRRRAEREWVPEMMRTLGLEATSLPVLWDADFLLGTTVRGEGDRYVLCEINVSAVWPFPPTASSAIAEHSLARIAEAAGRRGGD